MKRLNARRRKWLYVVICSALIAALQSSASSAYAANWDCSNGVRCCFQYNNGVEWCIKDHEVVQEGKEDAFTARVSHSESGDGEENVLASCVDRTLEFTDGEDPKGSPDDDSVVDEICQIGHDWTKICGNPPPSCGTCVVPGCKCINGECR